MNNSYKNVIPADIVGLGATAGLDKLFPPGIVDITADLPVASCGKAVSEENKENITLRSFILSKYQ